MKLIVTKIIIFLFFFANQVSAKDKVHAYFSNDSINGLKLSDAYETHNMGLTYFTNKYYFNFDLAIVSPDMHVYRNQYRKANRSFGEIVSLEIGETRNHRNSYRFYVRIKNTDEYGIDKIQDFAHRILSLQPVNKINELIRMPKATWIGVGLRSEFEPSLLALHKIKLDLDGFVGSDTIFLDAKFTKQFQGPVLTYDLSVGGRFVGYDRVISALPINAKERHLIPVVTFGAAYHMGVYNIFVRDEFSLPSIKSDDDLYGVLSAGVSYEF